MEQINAIVNWPRIDSLVMKNYLLGKSADGNQADLPLILMKCPLIQQWLKIDSDPELETQINDWIFFKKFGGFSLDDPAPDHSAFSRFRGIVSKGTVCIINNKLLNPFASSSLTINEGVAIDAKFPRQHRGWLE